MGYAGIIFLLLGAAIVPDIMPKERRGISLGAILSDAGLVWLLCPYIARIALLHGSHRPKDRLPPLLIGALIIPVSLLAYGWGTHTHRIVLILTSGLFTVGYMCTYLPVMMYLIDTYPQYAASAVAACTVLRSICSAILPLAADLLYEPLGYDRGNSLLALITLIFFPSTVVLARYGERIRLRLEPKLENA